LKAKFKKYWYIFTFFDQALRSHVIKTFKYLEIFWVISICLWFESSHASDLLMSVWIQMSHLTRPVNVKIKAKSLNCFLLAVTVSEMPREFPSVRWNWPSQKLRQIVSIFRFLPRPHFLPQTTWPEMIDRGKIVKPRN